MDFPLAPLLNNCILESGSLALNADCPRLKWTLGLASMLSDCYRPEAVTQQFALKQTLGALTHQLWGR